MSLLINLRLGYNRFQGRPTRIQTVVTFTKKYLKLNKRMNESLLCIAAAVLKMTHRLKLH